MPTLRQIFREATDSTLVQLFRYLFVGGTAFVADYGTLWALVEWAGLHYLAAAAIAFAIGLTVNYILCVVWVFHKGRQQNAWAEFAIFAIIGVAGLGLNEGIMYICTEKLQAHYMLSKIIATGIVFFWNFFARKYILFYTGKSGNGKKARP